MMLTVLSGLLGIAIGSFILITIFAVYIGVKFGRKEAIDYVLWTLTLTMTHKP